MMIKNSPLKLNVSYRGYPYRLVSFGIFSVIVYQFTYWGVTSWGVEAMGRENGLIENTQVVLATVTALCLFYAALIAKIGQAGLVACASMTGYAAAREADTFFEMFFFDDAYKWLVGLPLLLVTLVTIFRLRRTFIKESLWFMQQPAATLFVIGGVFLCGFCQILDRPDMWASAGRPEQMQPTKELMEELAELFAYLLLAYSGVETIIVARSTHVGRSLGTSV
ncbi:hypothetical protein [Aporhodopirellula aestuarii]|uniref:Uncharacterized protein n=1 Tax=Aporhodopirellula aestuarii TaxID=2950107 RepID=A0ABT0TZV5_9BACT|nr:hypothetical protein [Aporhodopirellula aestuarii]MCM2370141.1 hypothetical protein [Aporhodopirellula aestuarii]